MIRSRIQAAIDNKLCPTQYGFRSGRSTSHAIYILRRIQDYAEMKGAKMNMVFLDWEKAFDKVQHEKLFISLKRVGLSQHYVDVIRNCYMDFGESAPKRQSSGIPQGCPWSMTFLAIKLASLLKAPSSNRTSAGTIIYLPTVP